MDLTEAYSILTSEMEMLAGQEPGEVEELYGQSIALERLGHDGTLYRLELVVDRAADARVAIRGRIHDNSGYRFTLLEEEMILKPRT